MSQQPYDDYPAPQPEQAPFLAPSLDEPEATEEHGDQDAGLTIFENPAPPAPVFEAPTLPPPPAPVAPVYTQPLPPPPAPPVLPTEVPVPSFDGPALPPPTSLDPYAVPTAPDPVVAPAVDPSPAFEAPTLPPPPPAAPVPVLAEPAPAEPAQPVYSSVPVEVPPASYPSLMTFDAPAEVDDAPAAYMPPSPALTAVLDQPETTPDTQTGSDGGSDSGGVSYTVHEPKPRPAIERLLAGLVNSGGSDLHLSHGQPPRFRGAGALLPVPGEAVLTSSQIEAMCSEFLQPRAWEEFERNNDLDSAYSMLKEDGAAITSRFRVNVFRSMGSTGVVARVIPTKIVTMDQLGLPQQLKRLAHLPRGLVLFCGPTGSGKSTSMAALVDLINETRNDRIFTLEDPIEFVHQSKNCLISHREIGEDTPSFEEGLRRVRRQDPDVILVGEMRDYETIASAIEAADTGHLVIATLHTNSAPETISRIINQFPAAQQEQVRVTLASTLQAVICQTLVASPKSERGRVLAAEIMFVNGAIRNNIRENDIPAIAGALVDRSNGSQSLDAHLADLYRQSLITKKEALKKASSPAALEQMLGGPNSGR